MTAKQSPQEKEAKKAARAAARAAKQSSTTPAPPENLDYIPPAEQSSTPPEAAQEPTPEPATESAEETPTPKPEAAQEPEEKPKRGRPRQPKPCRYPLRVAVGSVVRYWLPLAGAVSRLIDATVVRVSAGPDKTTPPTLELSYPNRVGKTQIREAVRYVGHRPPVNKGKAGAWLQARTGKWMEFPAPPQDEPAPE